MELRVLRYFLTVAREENITKAAELLHVSQPAVSRQLAQLENELGVKLFVRSNHHIILTEDGLMLRRRAQEIVELAEKTQRDFRQHTAELTGEIAIGSGELRSFSMLGAVLAAFSALHPQVRYTLFSGNADQIKEKIENGTLDMGLLSMPVDLSKDDFLRFPVLEEYNAAMLVRQGLGAALCLRLDCAYADLVFVPISLALDSGSALVWKKHQIYSPAVSALIAHINAAVRRK